MYRILLLAALTVLAAAPPAAVAAEVKVPYRERSAGDAEVRRQWSDVIGQAQPLGRYAPWALVATVPIGEGRSITISQLWAGGLCSGKNCPIRVFEGDSILASGMACDDPDRHVVSDDGRMLLACDAAMRINRR